MNIVGAMDSVLFLKDWTTNPTFTLASSTGQPGVVYLSSQTQSLCNYYGLYPSVNQTSTRALPTSITTQYNLTVTTYLFNTTFSGVTIIQAPVYRHHWTQHKRVM